MEFASNRCPVQLMTPAGPQGAGRSFSVPVVAIRIAAGRLEGRAPCSFEPPSGCRAPGLRRSG